MAQYTINFSTNASSTVRDLNRVEQEITRVIQLGKSVEISLDTSKLASSLNATFGRLNKEIDKIQTRMSKLQIGSGQFGKAAASLGFREGQLERGRMIAEPLRLRGQARAFEEGSFVRLQKELQALQVEASQIRPNTKEWVDLQVKIAGISRELSKSKQVAETIQMRESLGAFSPGSLNQLEAKLTLLRNRAREISPDTEEWKRLNQEIIKAEKSIERQTRRPLTAGQRFGAAGGAFLYGGGLGGGVGSALGGVLGGLGGGVPGAFAGAAIGQAVDNLGQYAAGIATTVAEVNKAKIALAGVTRNVEDYNFAIQAATDASNNFLLPIADATRQFTRLQASVVGAGFNTATTAKAFQAIGAAIIATGGSAEDLNGALTAVSQVFSKGKVSAEELRGQIGERLPGAFTIFAQAIDKTPQQLDKMLQDGKVTLNDFIKFLDELNRRYASTAEQLAKAPENAGLRLRVALQAATVTFGGFFQSVGAGFQNYFADLVKFALDNEKTIKRVVTVFAIGFNTLGGLIGKFAKFLVDTFNKAFSFLLGNLETVLSRVEDAINRAKAVQALTPERIGALQERARKETERRYGGGFLGLPKAGAGEFYNKYFNQLVDEATNAARTTKYTQKIQNILFPSFTPTSFGAGLGKQGQMPAAGDEEGGKTKKGRKIPLKELLDLESQRKLELDLSNAMLRLDERIAAARLSGNEAEANSLENLREALKLRLEIAQLQDFQKMLIEKESEIVGKSLTQAAFNNKLQDTNVLIGKKSNELKSAYLDLQVKENEALKERRQQEQDYQRALEDIQIENKLITEEQAKQIQLARQYQDLLERFPFLTSAQKLQLREAIYAQQDQTGSLGARIKELREEMRKMLSTQEMVKNSAQSIGEAFGTSFKDIVSGSATAQQALASFFQSVGDYFLDMAARLIQKWIEMQIIGLVGSLIPTGGGLLTSGLSGGFSTGSAFSMAPGSIPAAGGITMPSFAGGISGGIQGFANGGMVTGPTLGLVGEGRYNEAIVPLPDGKSIPVDLGGAAGNQIVSNITVNVSNGQTQSNATGANSSELGRKLEGAVKQVIIGELRPGGLLSR